MILITIETYTATETIAYIVYITYGIAYVGLIAFFVVEGIRVSRRVIGKSRFRIRVREKKLICIVTNSW